MAPTSGILYVTMQRQASLPESQFEDWYNNDHGPTRLRLPFITNGFRYHAADLDGPGKGQPEWMAIYDITDMQEMTKEAYLRLREPTVKSQREMDTMKQIAIDRRLFDFVEEKKSPAFRKLEAVEDGLTENVLIAVSVNVHEGKKDELDRWNREEHLPMLSKVPGWLRSRRFVTSSIDNRPEVEYLSLHEYAPKNGLRGPEFMAATSTPWALEIANTVAKEKRRRVYDLSYTFGAAPRYLAPSLSTFVSRDGMTRTYPTSPGGFGAVESYVTTKDGVVLPFRLEGSSDPFAPLIVLSNSVLVTWGIWDGFVSSFFSSPQNKQYRILRYHTRGRSSNCGETPIILDVLSSDILALLDALRVPKAAAVIGVSLGGATSLNTALKHPGRVAAFLSCDTSSKSPPTNRKTWGERIAVAENQSREGSEDEKLIGDQLAEMTVRRWFVPASYDGGEIEAKIRTVKTMVETNSLKGFKRSVEALYDYDLTAEMGGCKVKGGFLVGSGDGVLPSTMKEMAAALSSGGAPYFVVDDAGHLPMVEKPQEVAAMATKFLSS